MILTNNSKNADPLGRYYTDPIVGSLLVNSIDIEPPSTVIDLCVGKGALIEEAVRKWSDSTFITVDIEKNSSPFSFNNPNNSQIFHYTENSLNLNLAERLGIKWGQADLALCNPPYIRPKWNKQFFEILEEANLSHVFQKKQDIPADMLFIAQNLRLLKKGGSLGLILPDGIITGEKYQSFRKTLCTNHRVSKVIELPRRIFKKTDAKAYIVVITKDIPDSDFITIQRLEESGNLSPQLQISTESAIKRIDYSYLVQSHKIGQQKKRSIGDVALEVFRGTYISSERKSNNFPIFHTTDFLTNKRYVPANYKLTLEMQKNIQGVIAIPGDILIARVGRNFNKKICLVDTKKVAITDCILVLRVQPKYRLEVFSFLTSSSGGIALEAISHGVGAKFITPKSLLELKF
ncbi:MAG: SAM-dependent DNA methyltransferase [Methylococcales bacterium]|nr:SAM-dependent DNA methyltransferase [Methylococcales bacterium]